MKRTIESDDDEIEEESFDFGAPKKPTPSTYDSWLEKYSPHKLADICVNPTKINQLRQVMQKMVKSHHPRVLVVTGPSGSGKSTACKLLSSELARGFVEYTESVRFEEFLNDGKYLVGKNIKFLIVEELPNVFHRDTLTMFRDCLTQWVYLRQTLPPLILCLTELERNFSDKHQQFFSIENNLNVNTLLPRGLIKDLRVQQLKFNSVSRKFVKSTIDKIVGNEPTIFNQIPKPQTKRFLEFVYETGDIRSSMNTLELWARFYVKGMDTTSDFLGETEDSFGRNVSISLFHAIGKIIYSSSKYQGLEEDESNSKTIEDVVNNYDNFHLLNLSVLENYTNLIRDEDIHSVWKMADSLSESELIYDLKEGKDYMCRSIRYELGNYRLRHEAKSRSGTINFTKNLGMIRRSNQVTRVINSLKDTMHTSFDNVNLVDGFYVPLILNKKLRTNYSRIGGRLDVHLEDNMYDNEEATEFDVEQYGGILTETDEEMSDSIDEVSDSDMAKKDPFGSDYEFSDESDFL